MSVGPTTLKLGWTNPLTGQFGAHPLLGAVLDLNDAATFTLLSPDGLELSPPVRSVVPAGNVRTQGERAVRAIYQHNRHARIGLVIGPMSSYAALSSTVRTLLSWLNGPPQIPFCVQWQPPSASAPVYLDVVACGHDVPQDESDWMRLQLEPVAIELWVRPGLRGDLVRLSNLVGNPGFEAPMGGGQGGVGTAAVAPVAFSDPFTTLAQYSQLAGGAPSLSPANTYVDVVMAQIGASLLRYYRLGEASGTSAYDIGGSGQTGTAHGLPTQGVAGAISGDTDTAYTFASASSQYVSLPTAGLPTGNAAWSIGGWVKIAGNPGTNAVIAAFGTDVVKCRALLYITSGGVVNIDVDGAGAGGGAALSLNTWHFVVATYDGTTLRVYVDGAAYGTTTAPGSLTVGSTYAAIGSDAGAQWFWGGQLDEVIFCNVALSSGQISAIYTAGHSGATGTLSNAMAVPSGATLGLGSPAWGAVQMWQTRLRFSTGISATVMIHRTDASDYLAAVVSGSALVLNHVVAGVTHAVATSGALGLVHEAWYWLQVTQFPAPPGDPPYVQAALFSDDNAAVGAQVAQIGGGCFDAVTALVGSAAVVAAGAALVLGGLAGSGAGQGSGSGNQVTLFGPGGWVGEPDLGATPAALAWEQTAGNTAPLGTINGANPSAAVMVPVQSLGAGRIDAPPASPGGWSAAWASGSSSSLAALQQSAMAVRAGGDALFFSGMLRASSNGSGYNAWAQVSEYNAAGVLVKTSAQQVLASGSGAVPWQAWNWNYGATQATTAYVILSLGATDVGSSSAGATTWFDNVQAWDVTATEVVASAGAMPYCELRAPNSPAQLLVSGLLGDFPAPAALLFGAYLASWPLGSVLSFAIGRAGQASSTAHLVGSSFGYFGSGGNPLASAALDVAGYGGFYAFTAAAAGSWSPRCFSPTPADAPGVYHLFQRFQSGQATGNIGNVQARANVLQRRLAWYGDFNFDDEMWDGYGAYVSPLVAGSQWTVCDAGQVTLPPQALGALTDPTQNFVQPHAQWVDNTGGGSVLQASWAALLPVDGSLLVGMLNNPANGTLAVAQQWVWAYFDGLLTNRAGAQDGPAWGYSVEAGANPNPAHAGGGPGTQTTGSININSGADPYLVLDPSMTVAQTGQQGVNQLVGYLADGTAAVLPFAAEIAYYPLYLWPR